jgi:hypothetical protein
LTLSTNDKLTSFCGLIENPLIRNSFAPVIVSRNVSLVGDHVRERITDASTPAAEITAGLTMLVCLEPPAPDSSMNCGGDKESERHGIVTESGSWPM